MYEGAVEVIFLTCPVQHRLSTVVTAHFTLTTFWFIFFYYLHHILYSTHMNFDYLTYCSKSSSTGSNNNDLQCSELVFWCYTFLRFFFVFFLRHYVSLMNVLFKNKKWSQNYCFAHGLLRYWNLQLLLDVRVSWYSFDGASTASNTGPKWMK